MTDTVTVAAIKLAEAFGPAGGMGLVFSCVVLYLYHKAHLLKHRVLVADRDVLLAVVTKNTEAAGRLAEAVDRLAVSHRESAAGSARQIETIVRVLERGAGRAG